MIVRNRRGERTRAESADVASNASQKPFRVSLLKYVYLFQSKVKPKCLGPVYNDIEELFRLRLFLFLLLLN